MIQRIQTIYLAIAVILVISFTFTPTFSEGLLFPQKWLTFLLTGALTFSGTLSLISIFLYNNRQRQSKIVLFAMFGMVIALGTSLGIFLSVGTPDFNSFTEILGTILLLLGWIFLFMARKAIQKDEKLIKSMDRIR